VVLTAAWDVLQPLLVCPHAEVHEAVCRVLAAAVRNAGVGLGPLLPRVIQATATVLGGAATSAQRAPLLELLEACGGVEGAGGEVVMNMAEAMRVSYAGVLPVLYREGFDEGPDAAAAVYRTAVVIAKVMPNAVSGEVRGLLGCAVDRGLVTQHREAGRAVLDFIGAVAGWCGEPEGAALGPVARAALEEGGVAAVGALLRAVNGCMPSWSLDQVVQVLLRLNQAVGVASFEHLLRGAVARDDVPRKGPYH